MNKDTLLNQGQDVDESKLREEIAELKRLLQRSQDFSTLLAKDYSAASWQLARLEYEMTIYRQRRILCLIDGIHDLLVRPKSWRKSLSKVGFVFLPKTLPQPPERADYEPKFLDIDSDQLIQLPADNSTRYYYPNVRLISVAKAPTISRLAPLLVLDTEWKDTLRPDMRSVDGVCFEINIEPETDFPLKLAEDVAKSARAEDVPVIVIVHSKSGLENPILQQATTVAITNPGLLPDAQELYPEAIVHTIKQGIDIREHNPTNWKIKPKHQLLVVGKKAPAKKKLSEYEGLLSPLLFEEVVHASNQAIATSLNGNVAPALNEEREKPEDICTASKSYRVIFSAPDMFESYSEFSQSVLELLACGAHIITTDKQISDEVTSPALHFVQSAADMDKIKDELEDLDSRERISVESRRKIMQGYGQKAVYDELLRAADIKTDTNETISVILCTNRPDYIDHAIENIKRQTYDDIELILVLHGETFDLNDVRKRLDKSGLNHRVVECPSDMLFGECLNRGLDNSTGRYVTKFDDDDHYGPEHLADILLAYQYSGAHVVGKWAHLVFLQESKTMLNYQLDRQESYVGHLPGGTFLIERALLSQFRFGRVRNAIDSELWYRIKNAGGRMYSTHRFNYIRVRHGDNTWNEGDKFFIERSEKKKVENTEPEYGFV